jgi:hypothetical protein
MYSSNVGRPEAGGPRRGRSRHEERLPALDPGLVFFWGPSRPDDSPLKSLPQSRGRRRRPGAAEAAARGAWLFPGSGATVSKIAADQNQRKNGATCLVVFGNRSPVPVPVPESQGKWQRQFQFEMSTVNHKWRCVPSQLTSPDRIRDPAGPHL